MAHTVEQLAQSVHQALKAAPGPAGRRKAADALEAALKDDAFIGAAFDNNTSSRHLLYEDAELGFCIFAHDHNDARGSAPHDHGPSWAIYGQAQGETQMTDWDLLEAAGDGKPGKVRQRRTYKLERGQAHVYNEGDLHAPSRTAPTRLIRIEGTNLDRIKRHKFEIV
jgi:hypothetical protein